MNNLHLTILGCCRNNEKYLEGLKKNIMKTVVLFKSYEIHIAHNDSIDNTPAFLDSWSAEDPNCFNYCIDGLVNLLPKRTERIAYCRNFLLEKMVDTEDCWVLILDMDAVNSELFRGFENVFKLDPKKWAALFINQDKEYYDIWALRTQKMNWDCWEMVRAAAMRGTSVKLARDMYVKEYQKPIAADSKVIPVLSAFGGAGLYQTKFLKGCEYIGLDKNGTEICEHVSFHEGITKNGGKMYILPCWQNKTPKEHIAP